MFGDLTTIILLAVLIGVVVLIGREFEIRYKSHADYVTAGTPSTLQQQARAGVFWLFNFAGDLVFPGSREAASRYKVESATVAVNALKS